MTATFVQENIETYRGNEIYIEFEWKNADASPYSLVGLSIEAEIVEVLGTTPSIASFAVERPNDALGIFRIRLTSAQILALLLEKYYWDCAIKDASNVVVYAIGGALTIKPTVTRF